jgi:hypothetical protein
LTTEYWQPASGPIPTFASRCCIPLLQAPEQMPESKDYQQLFDSGGAFEFDI